MSASRSPKCSYMNDTKWRKVIRVLVAEKIRPRIKLIYDKPRDVNDRFGIVVRAGQSADNIKSPEYIAQRTPKWCDSGSGPFEMEEIDWLAMNESDFHRIAESLPPNLKLVRSRSEVIIIAYDY